MSEMNANAVKRTHMRTRACTRTQTHAHARTHTQTQKRGQRGGAHLERRHSEQQQLRPTNDAEPKALPKALLFATVCGNQVTDHQLFDRGHIELVGPHPSVKNRRRNRSTNAHEPQRPPASVLKQKPQLWDLRKVVYRQRRRLWAPKSCHVCSKIGVVCIEGNLHGITAPGPKILYMDVTWPDTAHHITLKAPFCLAC